MNMKMSQFVVVALCVALSAQLVVARVEILSATGVQPINARAPDTCASDFLYQYAFNSVIFPITTTATDAPVNIRNCELAQAQISSTIVAPAQPSATYSETNPYTVTLNGRDFDTLYTGNGLSVPAVTPVVFGSVCLAQSGLTCEVACDASIPARPLSFVSSTQLTFNIQPGADNNWLLPRILFETTPRQICLRLNAPLAPAFTATSAQQIFTGFHFGAVYACTTDANCGAALTVTIPNIDLQDIDRRLIQAQTQCCQGQCINPNVQACCGTAGNAFERAAQRCCNGALGIVADLNGACPCRRQANGSAPICPGDQPSCCLPSKFVELTTTVAALTQVGECFNPNVDRCCNVGKAFNAGELQCCSITGLQDPNVPCPCQADTDCDGGSTQGGTGALRTPLLNQRCCRQTAPVTNPVDGAVCSAYQNFPFGNFTSFRASRCSGVCFDTRYQTCCNGAMCIREFERCCNTTCCNVFTSTCSDAGRRASVAGVPTNYREFATLYQQCTTVENLETVSVFWVYILPAALLIATLGSLALALVFTAKAAVRMFSFLEKLIIAMGIIVTIVACALYFSPAYKYGVVFSISAMVAIIASAARVRWITVVALIAVGLSVWYLLDPWHGNDYLTLAYWRLPNGAVDPRTAGLFSTLDSFWPERQQITNDFQNMCARYYNYFLYDPNLQDQTRFNNPFVHTFGYCTRGWITALLVLAGILWASLVFLFALLVLALILRFRKDRSAPIELEVRPEPFAGGAQYGAMPFVSQDPFLGGGGFMPAY